ncbi:ATP-binding protein involved in chromosome partitioning [Cryobacterium psychrophilum]|nr:ATP-binding protein involved in chromosome partitioning [Cryobacterium psychrophilum]
MTPKPTTLHHAPHGDAAPLTDVTPMTARVLRALAGVTDPEIRKPITELDMVSGVTVGDDGHVSVGILLTIAGCPAAQSIESNVLAAVESVAGAGNASVEVAIMTREQREALTEKLRGGKAARVFQFGPESLTRVYAITSGKGGVGKSTITANLAVALARQGLRVGIVDADVHGFSIPGLLGLVHDGLAVKPTQVGDMILPPISHDVKVISIGMFIDDASAAVAWRGPMLHRTINQFLTDVYFGDLDILLLDLPPGTGDVAITVGQLLPHAEVIVVTTPQPAAADVAERSGIVARQTGQKVYGVIENMSGLTQPDGSVLELFGSGGGAEVAGRLSTGQDSPVPVLAQVPLSMALRGGGDEGLPVVIANPDDAAAVAITAVATRLATRARGLSGRSLGITPL